MFSESDPNRWLKLGGLGCFGVVMICGAMGSCLLIATFLVPGGF